MYSYFIRIDSFEDFPVSLQLRTNDFFKIYQYANSIKNSRLIHNHGELENEENPMIFGYATTCEESKKLLDRNNV